MDHPPVAPRRPHTRRKQATPAAQSSPAPSPRPRLAGPEPRLARLLVPILIVGGLAVLHLVSLARLSELEAESRRLERLILAQTMRHGELMAVRAKLTDTTLLDQYAANHNLIRPASPRPVKVGLLPPGELHWALPGEVQIGTAKPVAPPPVPTVTVAAATNAKVGLLPSRQPRDRRSL